MTLTILFGLVVVRFRVLSNGRTAEARFVRREGTLGRANASDTISP